MFVLGCSHPLPARSSVLVVGSLHFFTTNGDGLLGRWLTLRMESPNSFGDRRGYSFFDSSNSILSSVFVELLQYRLYLNPICLSVCLPV